MIAKSGTDVMTREQRSRCMSRIRNKDTGPELVLRQALWRRGLRYRLHSKLPGRPDIVFKGRRVVVFVDGCFWHGCPAHGVQPKQNSGFWKDKLGRNRARDASVNDELRRLGWCVVRIWEHEVKEDVECAADRVETVIRSQRNS